MHLRAVTRHWRVGVGPNEPGEPRRRGLAVAECLGTEVTKSYGDVGQIPDAMFKSKGSRAARTVVGAAFGSDKANEDVAPVQAKPVGALGLSHLEKVA